MPSFKKNLEKFFIYFFTSVSVLVVILGIQRVKQSGSLGLTSVSEDESGSGAENTTTNSRKTTAGIPVTITGKSYQTPWGNLTTAIKVKDGKIIAVNIPTLPDSPPSIYAEPYLIDQVLRSGSADIQGVSGATITSRAFKASLESALAEVATRGGAAGETLTTSGSGTITNETLSTVPTQTTQNTRAAAQTITTTEVAKHSSKSDCWMTIDGKTYNLTSYIPYHPGGASTIVQGCGGDGTAAFLGVRKHLTPSVQSQLASYIVKTGTGTTAKAPRATTSAPPTTAGIAGPRASGTFTGAAYQTPWGNAVASVTFTNGKITGVSMPQVPNSPPSIQAEPYLIEQAISAGSANIQGVSGATYASIAFKSSLESAIAKAKASGTVATPTPSATSATTATQPRPSISRKYHDDWDEDNDNEWDD